MLLTAVQNAHPERTMIPVPVFVNRTGSRLTAGGAREQAPGDKSMIYELRIYSCLPGRLPDLMRRFEDHTLRIWDRHGIEQAGFWTTLVGSSNNDLTYMLRWPSLAERETRWNAFIADPEWQTARRASEANGPLLSNVSSQFLTPTGFSSQK